MEKVRFYTDLFFSCPYAIKALYDNKNGGFCAIGAALYATGLSKERIVRGSIDSTLLNNIARKEPEMWGSIVRINNEVSPYQARKMLYDGFIKHDLIEEVGNEEGNTVIKKELQETSV